MFLLNIIKHEKAFQSCLYITNLSLAQCCQLFLKFSGQNGIKIRPLSTKFGTFVKIASLIPPFHQKMTNFFN
jgi:hypothetical protein